ncbi:fucose permease [Natranaerovirga hydrolytica]|uniref:Fucose permease n=1 Tax=Natranaerovirga hydrolytica TaxID=680378 RepID=A0A4R1MMP2_9FIRM|nr:MFS transporter [Natranaerovirga hydrolytica]TCK93390.1 fucose permease [Natranaerovirga hydrolytica]
MNNKNKIILQTFYTFFVNGIMALMIGSIMPFIMEDYQLSYAVAGFFISLHSLGNLFASFVAGVGIYRFGRKKSIVVLSSLIALSYTGIVLTSYIPLLYVFFFLTGLGRGSVSNVNNAIINDIAVGKSSLLNLLHTFFAIGAFLTPIIASLITGAGYSWKVVVVLGIFLSASAVITYFIMKMEEIPDYSIETKEDVDDVIEEKEQDNLLPFYKSINFYVASALLFFYLGAENAVNGWLVTYFTDTGIVSVTYAQRLLSMLWVVIIGGRLLTAYLSRSFNPKTLILINSIGASVFFAILMSSSTALSVTVSLIAFGFFLAGIYPTTIASVGKVIKGSSSGMAILLAVAGIGGTIMPAVTGAVANVVGIAGGMSLITVSIILMLLLAIVLRYRANKEIQ